MLSQPLHLCWPMYFGLNKLNALQTHTHTHWKEKKQLPNAFMYARSAKTNNQRNVDTRFLNARLFNFTHSIDFSLTKIERPSFCWFRFARTVISSVGNMLFFSQLNNLLTFVPPIDTPINNVGLVKRHLCVQNV